MCMHANEMKLRTHQPITYGHMATQSLTHLGQHEHHQRQVKFEDSGQGLEHRLAWSTCPLNHALHVCVCVCVCVCVHISLFVYL